jgi:hypothetical protein
MLARLFEVKDTPSGGRGLFAKEHVPKGTILFFECKRIPRKGIYRPSAAEKNIVLRFGCENAEGPHTRPVMK